MPPEVIRHKNTVFLDRMGSKLYSRLGSILFYIRPGKQKFCVSLRLDSTDKNRALPHSGRTPRLTPPNRFSKLRPWSPRFQTSPVRSQSYLRLVWRVWARRMMWLRGRRWDRCFPKPRQPPNWSWPHPTVPQTSLSQRDQEKIGRSGLTERLPHRGYVPILRRRLTFTRGWRPRFSEPRLWSARWKSGFELRE